MPTYACTVMPSICELSFSKAVAWIQHEISPDHDFLIGQTEWLCANHATRELSVAVPRNDQPVVGGCNLAYSSPGGLWNHWKGNNEKGAQAEYRVGRDVQRFWICTGPLNFFPGTLIALLTCLSCGFCNQVLTASLSSAFCWDKARIDHIREHFEGLPGRPETQWKIEQWQEYKNIDDSKWNDLPQEWKILQYLGESFGVVDGCGFARARGD